MTACRRYAGFVSIVWHDQGKAREELYFESATDVEGCGGGDNWTD